MVTASMLALDALDAPPSLVVMTSTRDWVDDATLREATRQFARAVRRDVTPTFDYCWLREWTSGHGRNSGGIRRTHKHWLVKRAGEEHADGIRQVAIDVYGRITGATHHHVQRVWDAGGIGRYVAGLVGHHLKLGQAPPPGWQGRRHGTSRGYYASPASDLREQANHAVRDSRLRHRLERELADDTASWGDDFAIPADLWDDVLTRRLEEARARPKPPVVSVPFDYWLRDEPGIAVAG